MDIQEFKEHFEIVPIIRGINYKAIFGEFPVLIGDRIKLRETNQSDIPVLHNYLKQESIFKYYVQPTGEDYTDLQTVHVAYIESAKESFQNIGRISWAIVDKSSNALIGIAVCYTDNPAEQPVELEGFVSENFQRNRIGSEALNLIEKFFFSNGVKEIIVKESLSNKIGFKFLESNNYSCQHINYTNKYAVFSKKTKVEMDKYCNWRGQVFKGKAFKEPFYKPLEAMLTGGSYANVYFPIGEKTFIMFGCDPMSPKDFLEKNKDSLFIIDETKPIENINGATIIYAQIHSDQKNNLIHATHLKEKDKKQKLNGQQLGLLWISLSKNLFPKPKVGELYYEGHGNGSCTLYFKFTYYYSLKKSIDNAYIQGEFSRSNAEIDWMDFRTAINNAIDIEKINTDSLTIYELSE